MPEVRYLEGSDRLSSLRRLPPGSQSFIVLITGALGSLPQWREYLDECVRLLAEGGLLFVQGRPDALPELGVYLDQRLRFRYWIAVESTLHQPTHGLPSVHAAVLLFSKGERFDLRRVRFPHEYCAFCGRTLRDWGGKSHLMNPQGYAISDVWKGLPPADNYSGLSSPVLDTILRLAGVSADDLPQTVQGLVVSGEGHEAFSSRRSPSLSPWSSPVERQPTRPPRFEIEEDGLWDRVWHGDALEILQRYPDNSVDLVFADPPYNLDKAYHVYEDEQEREAYLAWCNAWLEQYIRILKPNGSLYILNLPHWTMYHAAFLNRRLYFQNWIVWDAVSEPRGKLLPAHYGLLFYTKHPTDFTFNYNEVSPIDARFYCLRSTCVRKRKAMGEDRKEPLTDIWWDIHRIKHRRHRDYHPCQLPDALLERIIRLSTNSGDIVLDALAGTGTTAVVAARLGRRYVAIDIDPTYVAITQEKLAQVSIWGDIYRPPVPRPRPRYNKKALQLELREIALQLGRLPTPEDVRRLSRYGLEAFLEAFPSWGKALKAAKLEVTNGSPGT